MTRNDQIYDDNKKQTASCLIYANTVEMVKVEIILSYICVYMHLASNPDTNCDPKLKLNKKDDG